MLLFSKRMYAHLQHEAEHLIPTPAFFSALLADYRGGLAASRSVMAPSAAFTGVCKNVQIIIFTSVVILNLLKLKVRKRYLYLKDLKYKEDYF